MDRSLPGSSVHGIFQARILEWVAISFSRRSSQPRDWTWVSCIVGRCFYPLSHQGSLSGICTPTHARTRTRTCCPVRRIAIPWTSYRGQMVSAAADLPNAGIEPGSPALQEDPLPTELSGKPIYKWGNTNAEQLNNFPQSSLLIKRVFRFICLNVCNLLTLSCYCFCHVHNTVNETRMI